jgi:gamma-glutamyltranspeptidase/glutathione hydrolase
MGGDNQPQIAAQNFLRHRRQGLGLTDALHAPRLTFSRAHGAARTTVKVESRFDDGVVRELGRLGHEVEVNPLPFADSFGHAGMLLRHPDGSVEADHDPRADGGGGGI